MRINKLLLYPFMVTFFSLLSIVSYSQRTIYKPLEYSKPIDNSQTYNQYERNSSSLKNSLSKIEERIKREIAQCQKEFNEYINKYAYVKPVKDGWNKAYVLSNWRCEIMDVFCSTNKVVQLKNAEGEKVSFHYSGAIDGGYVIVKTKDYYDEEESLNVFFHENFYNLSLEEERKMVAEKSFEEGKEMFKKENYAQSITQFTKAIENGDDPYYRYYRAWAFLKNNNYNEAIIDFKKLIETNPTPEAYFGRGYAKSGINDFYGANLDYTKAIELKPNYSMAYNNRGYNLCKLKSYNEALIDVNKAIELDPENYAAIDSRGEIYYNLKKYKESIKEFDRVLLKTESDNSYYFRAKSKIALGDKKGACEDLSKANELGNKMAYDLIIKHCN